MSSIRYQYSFDYSFNIICYVDNVFIRWAIVVSVCRLWVYLHLFKYVKFRQYAKCTDAWLERLIPGYETRVRISP